MSRGLYILDERGEPVECDDVLAWGAWFETAKRTVAHDVVGDARVSTVFLGVDHNFRGGGFPLLWETMVFGGPLDMEQERYACAGDALLGHAGVLARVMAAASRGLT